MKFFQIIIGLLTIFKIMSDILIKFLKEIMYHCYKTVTYSKKKGSETSIQSD